MRYRANSLVPAVFAGPLVAAVLIGTNWTVSAAAAECIGRPSQQTDQAGHWYYYTDRVHHRRCWYFETSEVINNPPASPDPPASPNADPQTSWFSRLTAGLTQAPPAGPQQSIAQEISGAAAQAVLPKHAKVNKPIVSKPKVNKVVRRERPRVVLATETTGAAVAGRYNQMPTQSIVGKDGKRPPQLTAADREALFQDFWKWYVDKSVFGRP